MKCVAVCQDETVVRILAKALPSSFETEFIVEDRLLARRLGECGITVHVGDSRKVDTYLKVEVDPSTCVLVEDTGRRSPHRSPYRKPPPPLNEPLNCQERAKIHGNVSRHGRFANNSSDAFFPTILFGVYYDTLLTALYTRGLHFII